MPSVGLLRILSVSVSIFVYLSFSLTVHAVRHWEGKYLLLSKRICAGMEANGVE
jgi:hypothetical protein